MDWSALEDLLDRVIPASALGEPVTYTPADRAAESIRGVLELNPVEVDLDTGVKVTSNDVRLGVRIADLSQMPVSGDQIVARGVTYNVADVEQMGGGWADLKLHLA